MPTAFVHVVTGLARSGKTELLLAGYRRQLAARPPGSCLWLAPTQRSAADVRGRLLVAGAKACLAPGVLTFEQMARRVVGAADVPVRPLSAAMKRHLLRRLVAQARDEGTLVALAPIADTPGLVEELAGWIGELKRHEIWPETLAATLAKGPCGPHERELAGLYERYQALLLAHQLYDAEGQFWSARAMLEAGGRGPLAALRYVVADGFTDFTHTQHAIFSSLAGWIDELHVSLPIEPEVSPPNAVGAAPQRSELFAKTTATLAELRRRHPQLAVTPCAAPDDGWPALVAICRELFADPRRGPVAESPVGVEFLPAARSLAEIEQVARRVKQLLTTGDDPHGAGPVAPGDIAVVFRRLNEAGPLVREVFAEYGIPTAIEAGRPLRDAPLIAALVALLSLDVEDWPFARLLPIVANSYFQPRLDGLDAVRVTAEWTVRELQVPRGRQALLGQIERLVAKQAVEGTSEEAARRAKRAAGARPWFHWLATLIDALPQLATAADWVASLDRLVDGAQEPAAFDLAAWRRAREIILAVGELAARLDAGATLDRRGLLALLNDVATREQLPADHDETGRVRVLGAASVRALRAPYLFVADLAEKSFPAASSESRLYSETEHQRLIAAGLPLAPRSEHASEEMLLFYEVVSRATRRLTLSYPAWDAAGQPLLPSPYLLEMVRVFGRNRLKIAEAPDLSPLPPTDVPRSEAEWRLLAVDAALDGEPALLAGLVARRAAPATGASVLGSLEAIADRRRYGEFGRYEGLFLSESARAKTADRFGPDHVWNATALEQLAACPFRFFGERVLGLVELPDLELDTDYRRRGSVAHELLARLHRKVNDAAGGPASLAGSSPEEVAAWIDELLGELLAVADQETSVDAALRLIDRRRLARDFETYPALHATYDQSQAGLDVAARPAHFEVSFGLEPKSADPRSTIAPLEIETAAGRVKIAGRIDRIDLGEAAGRTVLNVIDYKTGSLPASDVDKLMASDGLQLPLYARAAEELILAQQGATAWGLGYWKTGGKEKERGFRAVARLAQSAGGSLARSDDWQTLHAWIVERLGELVLTARAGQFPMASRDEKCTSYCLLKTVCRVNQTRALEKTWTPPSATPPITTRS